jgi:large subunit ribosomal protein L4
MTMQVALKNMAGATVGQIELNDSVFAAPVNRTLMHQALVRQLVNARLGTHKTKTRGEVEGGGKKPWRQKGTGRARQGSTRAPNWVGGGTVFGPTPRKYTKSLNKKMQRAALRSALSVKARSGQIVVLDRLAVDAPRTKTVVGMLKALGIAEQSVLMVLPGSSQGTAPGGETQANDALQNVRRSANNIANVKLLHSGYLNVRDLLGHDVVLLPNEVLPQIEQRLAREQNGEPTVVADAEQAGEGEE